MQKIYIAGLSLWLLTLVISAVLGFFSKETESPQIDRGVFSYKTVLSRLWESDKTKLIEQGTGRMMDPQRNNITTSEAQSYAMLRAVWMDDKITFDSSWQWTKDNLQHENDKLFSWLFGQRSDGTYGIMEEQGGLNSATDADTDIALALLFAEKRWLNPVYGYDAKAILNDVWKNAVGQANGEFYLASNDREWLKSSDDILLNPSYCSPYAYRIFAQVNPENNWQALIDSCYKILSNENLLSRDWVVLNRNTGQLESAPEGLSSNYGYDAMRIPWRLALDWYWFAEPRVKSVLQKYTPLLRDWEELKRVYPIYTPNGEPVSEEENLAFYGGNLGYFAVMEKESGEEIVKEKIMQNYSPDTQTWNREMGYYEANWGWFGLALYSGNLQNLYQDPLAGDF